MYTKSFYHEFDIFIMNLTLLLEVEPLIFFVDVAIFRCNTFTLLIESVLAS